MSSTEDAAAEEVATSSDSTNSTVSADPDVEETNPPSGPQSIETRGLPGGGAAPKRTTRSSSAST